MKFTHQHLGTHSSCWPWLALAVLDVGSRCVWAHPGGKPGPEPSDPSQPGSGGEQEIYIGYFMAQGDFITPIDFLLPYLNSPNRTILPRIKVMMRAMPYRSGQDEASKKVVESLRLIKPYAGMIGPRRTPDVETVLQLTQAGYLPQVHFNDLPSLTDRRAYPHSFRSVRDGWARIMSWYELIVMNAWTRVISLFAHSGEVEASIEAVASIKAARLTNLSVESVLMPVSSGMFEGPSMLLIVDTIKRRRMRTLCMQYPVEPTWNTMCYLIRAHLTGMNAFLSGSLVPNWYALGSEAEAGMSSECTPEEMQEAVAGYISVDHVPVAPGVALPGLGPMPMVPFDQSDLPLTCTPEITAQQLFGGEHEQMARAAGEISDKTSVMKYFTQVASTYDALCALLLSLHIAVHEHGVEMEDLEERKEDVYQGVIDALNEVEFQGAGGYFKFENGSGSPQLNYMVISQHALPSETDNVMINGIIVFNGSHGEPSLVLMDDAEPLKWRDNSTGVGPKAHLDLYPDCSLVNGVLRGSHCRKCQAGKYYDHRVDACLGCQPGMYSNAKGLSECLFAMPGFYVNGSEEAVRQIRCPIGHECPDPGMVNPKECSAGQMADRRGMKECKRCDIGFFQNTTGSSACFNCTNFVTGSTTRLKDARDVSECVCFQGMFMAENGTICKDCPVGMTCAMGSSASIGTDNKFFPQVNEGFMTMAHEPLRVYRCINVEHCPGGPPASCADHHDSSAVACGICASNAFESSSKCRPCGEISAWPIVCAIIFALMFLVCAAYLLNADMNTTPLTSITLAALAGVIFSSLQSVGVYSHLSVSMAEPLKSIIETTSVIGFELRILRVQCAVGGGHVMRFARRQLIAPAACPIIWALLLLKKYLYPKLGGKRETKVLIEFTNAVGAVLSTFLVSIIISAVHPFICYRHPSDSGESVVTAPSVLCFETSEHARMVTIGCIAFLLVPLPFLCLCCVAIYKYPRAMAQHSSTSFLHGGRFLFARFTPERYYFQLIIFARSFLLCSVPVTIRNDPSVQIVLMSAILCTYTLIQLRLRPWRAKMCDTVDAILHMLLILLLTCAALFPPLDEDYAKNRGKLAAITGALVYTILIGAGVGAIAYVCSKRLRCSRLFDYFICHHKRDAAAQARMVKILLESQRRVHVFLDSDNLVNLDKLFDIVRSELSTLIVYLTAETLRRPWCAGEIVTAGQNRVRILPVRSGSFAAPSEEQLVEMDAYIQPGCNLSEYHITTAHIERAYRDLVAMSYLDVAEVFPGRSRFDALVSDLLGEDRGQGRVCAEGVLNPSSTTMMADQPDIGLLVCPLPYCNEAIAAGYILMAGMAAELFSMSSRQICFMPDHIGAHHVHEARQLVRKATACAVILTSGTLASGVQMAAIAEVMSAQHDALQPMAYVGMSTSRFIFPTDAYFKTQLPEVLGLTEADGEVGDTVVDVMTFFRVITVHFPIEASKEAIDVAVDTALDRIKGRFGASAGGSENRLDPALLLKESVGNTSTTGTAVARSLLCLANTGVSVASTRLTSFSGYGDGVQDRPQGNPGDRGERSSDLDIMKMSPVVPTERPESAELSCTAIPVIVNPEAAWQKLDI